MPVRLAVTGDIRRELTRRSIRLPTVLSRATKDLAPDLVSAAQHAARRLHIVTISSSGKRVKKKRVEAEEGSQNIREHIARSVSYRVGKRSVTIFVDGKRMPAGKERLPFVTAKRRWRHPVFGNTDTWVEQRGRSGWFARSVRAEAKLKAEAKFQKAIERALSG